MKPVEVWDLIASGVKPCATAVLKLADCTGRICAQEVRADRDLPPADRSAMDGFAVRYSDVCTPGAVLRIIGEVAAGSPLRPRIKSGKCVRIFTGANVPPGADTVVMVENTTELGDEVRIEKIPVPGSNILKRGEDAAKGSVLLRKGDLIDASRIGVCASVGKAFLKVVGRPSTAVLCTGRELRKANDSVGAHQLRNSNGPAVCAAIDSWRLGTARFRSLPDDTGHQEKMIRQLNGEHDVLIITGGMSVGKYDTVRSAIERAGGRVLVHGVAMKPGKPFLYAKMRGGAHIFGLPGNPLSALTCLHEFVLPALRLMCGMTPADCRRSFRLPLLSAMRTKGGRTHYVMGRIVYSEDATGVIPVGSKSSADLVSAGLADGAIAVPPEITSIEKGAIVEIRPWRPLP